MRTTTAALVSILDTKLGCQQKREQHQITHNCRLNLLHSRYKKKHSRYCYRTTYNPSSSTRSIMILNVDLASLFSSTVNTTNHAQFNCSNSKKILSPKRKLTLKPGTNGVQRIKCCHSGHAAL